MIAIAKVLCLILLGLVLKHQRLRNGRKVKVLGLIEKGFHSTSSFLSRRDSSSKVCLASDVNTSPLDETERTTKREQVLVMVTPALIFTSKDAALIHCPT
jgi:hypothetical protein